MCFLAKKSKSKSKAISKPSQSSYASSYASSLDSYSPAQIVCPFQSQPQNRLSRIPHHVSYPYPAPQRSPSPSPSPTKGKTSSSELVFVRHKSKPKAKAKASKQERASTQHKSRGREMQPWQSVHAYGYPPGYQAPPPPPPLPTFPPLHPGTFLTPNSNHAPIPGLYSYADYNAHALASELESYHHREQTNGLKFLAAEAAEEKFNTLQSKLAKEAEVAKTAAKATEDSKAAKEKEDSMKSLAEKFASMAGQKDDELAAYKARMWKRDDLMEGVMTECLKARLFPEPAEVKKEEGKEWKKEVDGLRREIEEKWRREAVEKMVKGAREEGRKEVEEKLKGKLKLLEGLEREGEDEMRIRGIVGDRRDVEGYWDRELKKSREREYRRGYDEEYASKNRGADGYSDSDSGRRRGRRTEFEERIDDLEIFSHGFKAGRRDVGHYPPGRQRSVGKARGGQHRGRIADEGDVIDAAWGGGLQLEKRSGTGGNGILNGGGGNGGRNGNGRRGISALDDRVESRLIGIENSMQRVEDRWKLGDEKRNWERDYEQRDLMKSLHDTMGQIKRRLDG